MHAAAAAPARLVLALLLVLPHGIGGRAALLPVQAALLGEVPICHVGSDGETGIPPGQPAPHGHDCALCPLCHHATTPVTLSEPAAAPAPPREFADADPILPPPATGPPRPSVRTPPPRAPPSVSA